MPTAVCRNGDCEKDQWTLRKPLAEYKNGVSCPECGTTRVDVPDAGTQAAAQHQPARGQQVASAQARPADHGSQAQPPAQGGDPFTVAEDAGRQLAAMQNATPEEKAQFEGTLFQMAGNLLSGFGQQHVTEKLDGIERAEKRGGEEIGQPAGYPECGVCGGLLEDLPPAGQEFYCPHCNSRLEA